MARARHRRGARKRVRHPAFYETLGGRGTATLVEVSYSGARLEAKDRKVELGESVLLYLWPAGQAEPFEVGARVVGVRDDGFAVEFEERGQEVCQWVDALQASAASGPDAEPDREGRPAAGD